MNSQPNKSWSEKITNNRGCAILGAFVKSAAVGLLFAIVCFIYDRVVEYDQNKELEASVNKLDTIQKSLSIRSLGIFPNCFGFSMQIFVRGNRLLFLR